MAIYDYDCGACGSFSLWRSLEDRNLPARCPGCGAVARRLIAAPNLSLMSAPRRAAFARNEKSQHEPGIKTVHHCATGCGCNPKQSPQAKSTRTVDLGKVGKFETSRRRNRPWMLGH
jgi:putative FmdB family regulatory protein